MSRRLLAAGAVVLLAIIGGLLWLHGHSHSAASHSKGTGAALAAAPPKPAASAISPANVHLLERALDSSSRQSQAAALAAEVRSVFLASSHPMLPPGATVTIEPKTFQASGTAGVVEAKTSIGKTFTLRLVREQGTWLILYTVEAS